MERKKNYVSHLGYFVVAALAMTAPAFAAENAPWPVTLRSQITRLTDVGYRIGVVAAPLCPSTMAGTGMALDYLEAYDARDRAAIAALLHMTDAPQIAAVAPNSPAEAAGVKAGDEVLAIGATPVADLLAASSDTSLFADELEKRIAATPAKQDIELRLRRAGRVFSARIAPRPICAARYVIKTNAGMAAFSDGANVAISSAMIAFTQNDDELALIAAHETGHIVNRDGKASGLRMRRRMEDRADLMSVRLTHCAGYDLDKAFEFWARRDAQDWLGFLRSPTHRSRKSRVELMRAEAQDLSCPPTAAYAPVGT